MRSPDHDNSTNDMAPTMGILAIEAGTPTYNATLTATTMSTASGHERVYDNGNDNYALLYPPPLGVLYTRWNELEKHHL